MVRISRRLILGSVLALAGLLVLAVAALVVAALAIDPERMKPRIQRAFHDATGRELQLGGELAWQFFPWIVIRSGGGAVGNPEGFGGTFAAWRTLRLGVQLLPLFDRQVIVDSVVIDGLALTAVRRADGTVNWSVREPRAGDGADGTAAAADAEPAPSTLQFAVDEVQLTDARLAWHDEPRGQQWQASGLALQLSVPGRATPRHVELHDIAVKGRLAGTPLPNVVDIAFEAQRLNVDADPLRLRLPAWKGALAGAALEGGFDALLGGEDRRIDGRIAGRVESLREVLRAVGVELPLTRDAEVFGNVELDTSFALDEGRIATESLSLRVDDTHVRGSLTRAPIEDGTLRFALIADRLDIDRYLEPEDARGEPFELELGPLRELKAEGELRIDEAHWKGATLRGMTVNVE